MHVVARHRTAPLVALSNGTVIDTEDLEVVGNGFVASAGWELDPSVELDPRWEEIARADASNLGVTERRLATGSRTFRAPAAIRDELTSLGIDSPLAEGKGLTLDELGALCEHDGVTGPAEQWMFGILNKHEDNPTAAEEHELFSLAEPELDYDEIESAMEPDELALIAAIEPPPVEATKVVYLAIIEEDDQKSVQDLVALVQTKAGAAAAYTYGDKGWEESQESLAALQSAAPPPIKQLEDWQTESIIAQMQSTGDLSDEAKAEPWEEDPQGTVHAQPENPAGPQEKAVQASGFDLAEGGVLWGPDNRSILSVVLAAGPGGARGGLDRNRGGAETLRRYWTTGEGGLKIRWGTPGDWTRCRRHLSKYLGPRAAGYCQLRHKEMTGMWTGDRAHRLLSAA
jgi:hypothetical protein